MPSFAQYEHSQNYQLTAAFRSRVAPFALILLVSLFFVFGIITVTNDLLIAHLSSIMPLTESASLFFQVAFFGGYLLMAVPASRVYAQFGVKSSIITGLILVAFGCIMFFPAAELKAFPLFLLGIFIMSSGITLMQVVANPYIAQLGEQRSAASRLNLAGGFNSMATVIGPLIGVQVLLADNLADNSVTSVQMPYLVLAGLALVIALAVRGVRFPELKLTHDAHRRGAMNFRNLRLGIVAIFLYVGTEVAVASYLTRFLMHDHVLDLALGSTAKYVSIYWAGAMVGRILGFGYLHKISTTKALTVAAIGAGSLIFIGVNSPTELAIWCFIGVGLFNSIMWPCIFPLAIKNLGRYTAEGSSYLIMGVVGGVVIPLIQGVFADMVNLQTSFLICGMCYAYIIFYGVSGHKKSAI